MTPGITIRPLGPADEEKQLADLQVRAFGPLPASRLPAWRERVSQHIGDGRYLAAFDGSRLVAAADFHDMRQWWLGRAIPVAGVASVKVAPEDRGRGAGRAIMTELLQVIAGRGYPESMLYPSTLPLYRSLGWELAGRSYEVEVPAGSLRRIGCTGPGGTGPGGTGPDSTGPDGPVPLRRATPDDAATVRRVLAAAHTAGRDSGPIVGDEPTVRRWLSDDQMFGYLAADGFLGYRWQDGNRGLRVDRAVAVSAATTRALWALIAGHSTIATTVRAVTGPADPLGLLLRDPDLRITSGEEWMLRVVDAPAAIAARGFPPGLELALPLRLEDAQLPANAGDWTLSVHDGHGYLERSLTAQAADPVTVGARGFAALFAGTPVRSLRRAGLAGGGDPAGDALLDAGFAATPFCLDFF